MHVKGFSLEKHMNIFADLNTYELLSGGSETLLSTYFKNLIVPQREK